MTQTVTLNSALSQNSVKCIVRVHCAHCTHTMRTVVHTAGCSARSRVQRPGRGCTLLDGRLARRPRSPGLVTTPRPSCDAVFPAQPQARSRHQNQVTPPPLETNPCRDINSHVATSAVLLQLCSSGDHIVASQTREQPLWHRSDQSFLIPY